MPRLKINLSSFFLYFIFLFLLAHFHSVVAATNYQTTFDTHYKLSGSVADVSMHVTISDLSPDIYIKEYGLIFPKSFPISGIHAQSNGTDVPTTMSQDENNITITFTFPSPIVKQTQTDFTVTFTQDNLVKNSGNITEVVLPSIENNGTTSFNTTLILPPDFNKKISLSKPIPDSVDGNVITWNNVKSKTIYVAFGDVQNFKLDLSYHLKNTQNTQVYTDIAFPPETQYQSITVDSIIPKPLYVYLDHDGNYLGRYNLLIGQKIDVTFKGYVQTYIKPQESMYAYTKNSFSQSQSYLLSPRQYWSIDSSKNKTLSDLKDPQQIYSYTTSTLTYNYNKLSSHIQRLGASAALDQPNQAVCMEFTDLFVGLARDKGIYTREIEGYGYTDDQHLRPLSLVSDVLHSWPEYYDQKSNTWIRVDPTWENTSGIDYFSSFDFNHIDFVNHGEDSVTPYPAGTYKVGASKDVLVTISQNPPTKKSHLSISNYLPSTIISGQTYHNKLVIKNDGNSFIKGVTLTVSAPGLDISPLEVPIDLLPPQGEQTLLFTYRTKDSWNSDSVTLALSDGDLTASQQLHLLTRSNLILLILGGIGIIGGIAAGIYLSLNHRHDI